VTVEPDAAALDALRAAEISGSRQGTERTRRLSAAERRVYRWILREFAAATPPSGESSRAAADALGLEAAETFRVLASEELVHVDASGRPVVAYPFSAKPRGHRVLIDGERWVEAMCAIDALGIAPMLGLPIEIYSRDPVTGGEIWVRLDPSEGAWWEPKEAVRPRRERLLRGTKLPRLLRCAQLFRARRERCALPRREPIRVGSSDLGFGGDRGRPHRLRRPAPGGLMPTAIDRDEVQRLVAGGAQLVEVLPAVDYDEEHLGAINIPLKELDRETTRQLERERPVIVYCHDYQ
jgi:Alkylmercury lyase